MYSTADGKVYRWIICPCGKQNAAGICEHVSNPIIVEEFVTRSSNGTSNSAQ